MESPESLFAKVLKPFSTASAHRGKRVLRRVSVAFGEQSGHSWTFCWLDPVVNNRRKPVNNQHVRLVSCFLTVAATTLDLHPVFDEERGGALVEGQQNPRQRV